MGLRLRDAAGTLRVITRARVRDAAGVLRSVVQIRLRDAGGTLRTIQLTYTVELSTYVIAKNKNTAGAPASLTTASVTSTVVGGTAPYTYVWSKISGSSSITITTPTASSTTFSVTAPEEGVTYSGDFKLTVTDNLGNVVVSSPVAVSFRWVDPTL